MPSQIYLRTNFIYEETTGKLLRRTAVRYNSNSTGVGTEAGWKMKCGYRSVKIKRRSYLAHRLIWIYLFGSLPSGFQIDHINHDKLDNRRSNLRLVTPSTNASNRYLSRTNSSGHTGVSFNRVKQKWEAYISHQRKRTLLGYFSTKSEAAAARRVANRAYRFHKNHGKKRPQQIVGAEF